MFNKEKILKNNKIKNSFFYDKTKYKCYRNVSKENKLNKRVILHLNNQ